jgi:hypothetical protein
VNAPHVVGEFRKNARETLRVALVTWQDRDLLDVRLFVASADDPSLLMPTRKGLSMSPSLLPALRALISEAEEQARIRGWLE